MVSSKVFLRICPLLGLLYALPAAYAQEDFWGSRSMGMAGAHRAIATSNDAIYLNPAGMSQTRKYSIEAGYLFDPGRETHVGNISIVDSVTSRIAAGIAFSYISGLREIQSVDLMGAPITQQADRKGKIVHLAMSMPLSRQLFLGISGKYVDVSYDEREAANSVSANVGLIYRASNYLSLGLAGYGLTNSGSAEDPVAMGISVALGPPSKFQFGLDWIIDFTSRRYLEDLPAPREGGTSHQIRLGFELLLAKAFAIRAGYFHDRTTRITPDNGLAVGFGYFSAKAKFGFTLAYQQRFRDTSERQLVVGLNILL